MTRPPTVVACSAHGTYHGAVWKAETRTIRTPAMLESRVYTLEAGSCSRHASRMASDTCSRTWQHEALEWH